MVSLHKRKLHRYLPSIFSETNQIFAAAATNALLGFIIIPIITYASQGQTNPSVQVFLLSVLSIGIGVTTLVTIVLPHIRRASSGEKIVISNLLRSHEKSTIEITAGSRPHTLQSVPTQSILVKRNDPMPRKIEESVLRVQEVLQLLSNKRFVTPSF